MRRDEVTNTALIAPEDPTIFAAWDNDIPAIVRIHQAAFPGFFLTQMGPAFLRAYYRLVQTTPGGIVLVAARGGQACGFVAGFIDPDRFYQVMRQRKWSLVIPLVLGILRQPSLARRVLTNFRRVRAENRPTIPETTIIAELSSIGVDPASGGRGLGRTLTLAFIDAARTGGADGVLLTTDAQDNDRVNQFYQQLGFRLLDTYTEADGRIMNAYGMHLLLATIHEG